jgi:D-amino-acid dehydrogenase
MRCAVCGCAWENVEGIEIEEGKIAGIRVASAERGEARIAADAYVVATGSYSAPLLRPLGIRIPVYPVKGYSVTFPAGRGANAPTVSLTDEAEAGVFAPGWAAACGGNRRTCGIRYGDR